jgi:hypothetical protein
LTLHRGGKSSLHEIEDSLLQFIFEAREQGLAVSLTNRQLQLSIEMKIEIVTYYSDNTDN